MAGQYIEIGDVVKDSPKGAGTVTDISDAGYPRVNHVAVAWMERDDSAIFDPRGVRGKHLAQRAQAQKGQT
jgi:hypothetical protein